MNEFEINGFYTERGFYSERYMDELRDEVDSITQTKGLLFLNEIQIHKESPIIK